MEGVSWWKKEGAGDATQRSARALNADDEDRESIEDLHAYRHSRSAPQTRSPEALLIQC